MSCSIVTTTIHEPVLFADYCRNLKRHGHESVEFIVVGDQKTPQTVHQYCRQLQETSGYVVEYYDVDRQTDYLERFPELAAHLPYHSIQRRNIGFLVAFERGAEVVITVDDDNLVTDHDFVGSHRLVGSAVGRNTVTSSTGWFDVCRLLVERAQLPFYHRGYPLGQRWKEESIEWKITTARIVVNAGLWLGDPDIDALTRMTLPIEAVAIAPEGQQGVMLGRGTWCPFNSQNTALARDVIPAYFLSPFIGRYDDVWASYFLRAIIDHLGDAVHYGPPLVRQVRNPHDLWKDLEAERLGLQLTDRLISCLRRVTFTCQTYEECYRELAEQLTALVRHTPLFTADEQATLSRVLEGMDIWSRTFERLSALR